MKVRTAVIPVAGKGTRFLPATKEIPKEMIPILKRPMIDYVVMEAVESGIEQIVFVSASGKTAIEDYFDRNIELEDFLERNGKEELAGKIRKIGTAVEVLSVRQKEQLGLGHAILCAKSCVSNEPFAVLLGDDLTRNHQYPVTKQLIDIFKKNNADGVIGVMEVPNDQTDKYGIVAGEYTGEDKKTLLMSEMVEKPDPASAPTNLATPGRYILPPSIFEYLEKIKRGVGGEYQLTDALNLLCRDKKILAHVFEGDRFDTGSLLGYLDATVDFALEDESLRNDVLAMMERKKEIYSRI